MPRKCSAWSKSPQATTEFYYIRNLEGWTKSFSFCDELFSEQSIFNKKLSDLYYVVYYHHYYPEWLLSIFLSNRKILRFVDFQALGPKIHVALEPKVLKLEGSSFGKRPSIYVLKGWYNETPIKVKVPRTVILGVKAPPPRPALIRVNNSIDK